MKHPSLLLFSGHLRTLFRRPTKSSNKDNNICFICGVKNSQKDDLSHFSSPDHKHRKTALNFLIGLWGAYGRNPFNKHQDKLFYIYALKLMLTDPAMRRHTILGQSITSMLLVI